MHSVCWDILLQRVPVGTEDMARFATIFFQTLFCTNWGPKMKKYLRPGHDCGGAARFQEPVGEHIRQMAEQGFAWILGCPVQICDVPEILALLAQYNDAGLCFGKPTPIPSPGLHSFSSLPVEVLYMVLSLLPSLDIAEFRLTSRSVASVTDPVALPQSFWRSRFCADAEMGFALPANKSTSQNWRDAYLLLKKALGDGSSSNSCSASARLRSHRRIWNIVGINASLLAQYMADDSLHGRSCAEATFSSAEAGAETSTGSSFPGAMIRTPSSTDEHNLLRSGSRKLHDRDITLPLSECRIVAFRISTILFNSQEFVSGLQFTFVNTASHAMIDLSLGFISTKSQLVEVAPWPQWTSDMGNSEAQFAFGILRFDREGADIRLTVSFDAFKMIALGMAEDSSEVGFSTPFVSQPTWTPTYPRRTVTLAPEPQNPRPDTSSPILNIDFGGPGGERLTRLTRIVAHMLDKFAPFVGLSFYFNDQGFIHFGRKGSMEVSSLIKGPGGQLISNVIIRRSTKDDRVLSQWIRTNHGHELIFSSNELQHSQVKDYVPILHNDQGPNPFIEVEEKLTETFEPLTGHLITGLTATTEADTGLFLSLGLPCEKLQQASDPTKAGEKKDTHTPLRYLPI
ncbi:hypothetical protein BDW74DRAFT_172276 [Aspergillus multicolor]|uniref:uncharacterized protein n=1 Tax=Aspergillus multicolor TaxID=41759 RepID=UPI003CCD4DBA